MSLCSLFGINRSFVYFKIYFINNLYTHIVKASCSQMKKPLCITRCIFCVRSIFFTRKSKTFYITLTLIRYILNLFYWHLLLYYSLTRTLPNHLVSGCIVNTLFVFLHLDSIHLTSKPFTLGNFQFLCCFHCCQNVEYLYTYFYS